jgi:hypothetical protein
MSKEDTTMSKVVLMVAQVQGATGGFGMYQMGEGFVYPAGYRATDPDAQWDDADDAIRSYLDEAGLNGWTATVADDIDGKVYGQDNATIYRFVQGDDKDAPENYAVSYEALWTIPAPVAEED